MQAAEPDPRQVLRGLGTLTAEVTPRIARLLLLLTTAAETDSALAELRADLDATRLTRMNEVAKAVVSKTQLRPSVSIQEAGEIMWTYSSTACSCSAGAGLTNATGSSSVTHSSTPCGDPTLAAPPTTMNRI